MFKECPKERDRVNCKLLSALTFMRYDGTWATKMENCVNTITQTIWWHVCTQLGSSRWNDRAIRDLFICGTPSHMYTREECSNQEFGVEGKLPGSWTQNFFGIGHARRLPRQLKLHFLRLTVVYKGTRAEVNTFCRGPSVRLATFPRTRFLFSRLLSVLAPSLLLYLFPS